MKLFKAKAALFRSDVAPSLTSIEDDAKKLHELDFSTVPETSLGTEQTVSCQLVPNVKFTDSY